MYSLTKKVISVLLITAIVVLSISTAIASSFDDIMNLPDYEETGNSSDYLEFDDFLVDFHNGNIKILQIAKSCKSASEIVKQDGNSLFL